MQFKGHRSGRTEASCFCLACVCVCVKERAFSGLSVKASVCLVDEDERYIWKNKFAHIY